MSPVDNIVASLTMRIYTAFISAFHREVFERLRFMTSTATFHGTLEQIRTAISTFGGSCAIQLHHQGLEDLPSYLYLHYKP